MEIAFYPKNEVILRQGDQPPDHLFIIHTGSVKAVTMNDKGEQILVDILEKGDLFGATSILEAQVTLLTIIAAEDLIVLLLPAGVFRELFASHKSFQQCFQFSLSRYFHDMLSSSGSKFSQLLSLNSFHSCTDLIGKRVSDLMVPRLVHCAAKLPIRDASKLMTQHAVGSIVIDDGFGHAAGIITDTDLRKKVIAEGISIDDPVDAIMSSPVHTIGVDDYAFDALLKMSRYGISHLVVQQGDSIAGIISEHDFRVAIGSSPVGLIAEIERSESVGEMVELHGKIDRILETLLRQGCSVERAVDLITELNDRVTVNLLRITEEDMIRQGLGQSPAPFCWMALGSEGRREQTLRTDQDNALIFAAVPDADEQGVRHWFERFSEQMVESLVRCGFPRCPGGIMASNPRWCQSESGWKRTFSDWIVSHDDLALRMATIFFDCRAVFENANLMEPLRSLIGEKIRSNNLFLPAMARIALGNRPPLGLLRRFVLEKSGEHKNMLDLKWKGLMPIIESARVLALDLGVHATNTLERLEESRKGGLISDGMHADLKEAFNFINYLRIDNHLSARSRSVETSNYIDPRALDSLHRKILKESFSVISRFQEVIELRYDSILYFL